MKGKRYGKGEYNWARHKPTRDNSIEEIVKFKKGDIYEDCAFHPVVCENISGDDIEGVSLLDGSRPRRCSIKHCGVRKITKNEVAGTIAVWRNGGEQGLWEYKKR
jgi:hypothetical protein